MSGFAAHLTATSKDANQPSIFEVIAQEGLVSSLRPALHHILRVLAQNNPAQFSSAYLWREEIYYMIKLLVDNHYLKNYGGSFAENFYGIKRVPLLKGDETLTSKHRMLSLICLTLLPYLKQKCDTFYENERDNYLDNPVPAVNLRMKILHAFLKVYPIIHMCLRTLACSTILGYVLGKVPYHTPLLPLAQVHLHLLNEDDMSEVPLKPISFAGKSFIMKCYLAVKYVLRLLASTTGHVMSAAMFFVQFVDWWYTSDTRTPIATATQVPPPNFKDESNSVQLPSICPLCHRVRTNHTALAVSGYVFCYPCIHKHIDKYEKCPITNYPANHDHLIRIMQT